MGLGQRINSFEQKLGDINDPQTWVSFINGRFFSIYPADKEETITIMVNRVAAAR